MTATIVSILMIMLGYFLILYGVVGFIQDKRFFSSAPKEYQVMIIDKKERFKGAHVIGYGIVLLGVLLFIAAFILVIWDGMKNEFGFIQYFIRFLIMLYVMEIYDIIFFDYYLLCHSNFFIHFYPELKDIDRTDMFGYNKKTHIMHFIVYIPICAVLALCCVM